MCDSSALGTNYQNKNDSYLAFDSGIIVSLFSSVKTKRWEAK